MIRATRLAAVAFFVALIWIVCGLPILVDRLIIDSAPPIPARAIVCLGGGLGANNLPTPEGWERVYTAVQLYADGFAPIVVFSGGGSSAISEAEVYAQAAEWLGLPHDAVGLDPLGNSTAEQAQSLAHFVAIGSGEPVNVVTSPLHSRRVAMCFRKAGFTKFKVVTSWISRKKDAKVVRQRLSSGFAGYSASTKSYADMINRTRWNIDYALVTARELSALVWYRLSGKV